MARKTIEIESTGQAYLELLRERGIEYFFANGGTDFAPIIDGFARFAEQASNRPGRSPCRMKTPPWPWPTAITW